LTTSPLTTPTESNECPATESTILNAEAADPTNHVTKSQSRAYTKQIAYHLRNSFGIGANGHSKDVVVAMCSGQILLPTVFYGVIAAGGVYSAASSAFTYQELARQVRQGKASVIVASEDCVEVAVQAAKEVGLGLDRVLVLQSMGHKRVLQQYGGARQNFIETFAKRGESHNWDVIRSKKELDERIICLLYSSGTTGVPKGVKLSNTNLVSEGLIPFYGLKTWVRNQEAKDPNFKFEYRTLAHLPAAHIAGVQGYCVNPALTGGITYWMPKFDFPKFLEYNEKYGITTFFTVPPIYLLIAKSPLVKNQFKTLVHAISGAAPMGADLTALAESKLGAHISQTWGLSETTGSVTGMPWDQHDTTGSLSPLLPNTRLRILDDDENDVEEGQDGELCVQGPMVTRGYWDNDAATKESFTKDGLWFKTGDVGLRRDNMFYIVDRKKELIKYKGLQVAPAELEALLVSHNEILDAAVIGIPDPDGSGNELPRAYVVVADKQKTNEDLIKKFVADNLARHKQLRGGVIFLDAIPKSPSGKILRRELREMAKKEGSKLSKL
jgi:acyl-CoA synthetase (AMP-forming)/AMP-acid ligase II